MDAAKKALEEKGAAVRVVDLVKIKFNPDGGPNDFASLK